MTGWIEAITALVLCAFGGIGIAQGYRNNKRSIIAAQARALAEAVEAAVHETREDDAHEINRLRDQAIAADRSCDQMERDRDFWRGRALQTPGANEGQST